MSYLETQAIIVAHFVSQHIGAADKIDHQMPRVKELVKRGMVLASLITDMMEEAAHEQGMINLEAMVKRWSSVPEDSHGAHIADADTIEKA